MAHFGGDLNLNMPCQKKQCILKKVSRAIVQIEMHLESGQGVSFSEANIVQVAYTPSNTKHTDIFKLLSAHFCTPKCNLITSEKTKGMCV